MDNPFIPDIDSYSRQIEPVRHYVEQMSLFISKQRSVSIDEARQWVISRLKRPDIKIPTVRYTHRQENGDKVEKKSSILKYIKDSVTNKEIIAPSLTTYLPKSKVVSVLSTYTQYNVKERSTAKKEMFAAEARGDIVARDFKNGEQSNYKLANNAASGMFGSLANVLHNPSAHSTLTSNCRITAAFGSANNEKMLSGNRHYHSPEIVMYSILSISSRTDSKAIRELIDTYKLHIPTIAECMDTIRYSTELYWQDSKELTRIESLVAKLTDEERVSFVYTADLYSLGKYNPELVKTFVLSLIGEGSYTPTSRQDDQACVDYIKQLPEDISNLANALNKELTADKGKDYQKWIGSNINPHVARSAEAISYTLQQYYSLIKVLFSSDNAPSTISHFPSSIRRAALTGDTDSTLFTVQSWVKKYNANCTDSRAHRIGQTMIFLSSQAICHLLARMSANAGFAKEDMRVTAMKNEFYFPVFVPTSVNKHYFASITSQEGNNYSKPKREYKGVHLLNSNVPPPITNEAKAIMNSIMDTVMNGEKLSIVEYIKKVADFERFVTNEIKKGNRQYLRAVNIKDASTYTAEPHLSPYYYYLLWERVFAPKYGSAGNTPLPAVAISTTLTTTRKLNEWIQSLEDRELADRLVQCLKDYSKTKLATIAVPVSILTTSSMPSEIASIIDTRSLVKTLCSCLYSLINTLGYNPQDKKGHFLCSDLY